MLWFIFVKILVMSGAASFGGILVFVFSKIFYKKLSKKAVCALWILPLLAAAVPVSIPKKVQNITQTYHSTAYTSQYDYDTFTSDPVNQNLNAVTKDKSDTANAFDTSKKDNIQTKVSFESVFNPFDASLKHTVSFIYFFVVFVLLLRLFAKKIVFEQKLKRTITKCDYPHFEECKKRLNFSKKAAVYSINADCSPFVFGILRPKIVLPFENTEKTVFIHEMVHIKNRDTLKLMVLNIIKCIHFFNPLIYFFAKKIKLCTELCCDEEVAAVLNGDEKLEYGKNILNCSYLPQFSAVCLSENGENTKERILTVMNTKNSSKKTKVLCLLLASILFVGQTAFSAAAGVAAPQKSYAVNHTSKVYSLVWKNGKETLWSKKSGLGANSAALVNTPFFKTFSADLKTELTPFKSSDSSNETPVYADIHIETDKILKTINNGKHWSGLFSVTVNGKTVLSKAKGSINYIPGDYARKPSRLFISDKDTSFELEYIDFDTKTDGEINLKYENYQKINFEPQISRVLICTDQSEISANKTDDFALKIKANKTQGKLYTTEIPFENSLYIETNPEETYKFANNSVSGKFYLKRPGGIIIDEFFATLDGFESGNRINLKSKDKKIDISLSCANQTERYDQEHLDGEWTGLRYGLDDGSDFPSTCKNRLEPTTLDLLPFTLELNKEKTKIIFKIKDGFSPDGWYYSYASYSNTEKDIYARCESKEGNMQTELEICTIPFADHNMQFNYYTSDPFARFCFVDIMFKITDGKIYYRCCNNYITENKNYSGQKAKDALEKYILIQK